MRFLFFGLLVIVLSSACVSQDPVCVNGSCKVPVPSEQPVRDGVKAVASAPQKVFKRVQSRKPVRSFFRRLFR
jgi:hypothetical protein